jgi:hypothetical protein
MLELPIVGQFVLVGKIGEVSFIVKIEKVVGYENTIDAWIVQISDDVGAKNVPVVQAAEPREGKDYHYAITSTKDVYVGERKVTTDPSV